MAEVSKLKTYMDGTHYWEYFGFENNPQQIIEIIGMIKFLFWDKLDLEKNFFCKEVSM